MRYRSVSLRDYNHYYYSYYYYFYSYYYYHHNYYSLLSLPLFVC